MRRSTLLKRSLVHHARSHLALFLTCATTCAILCGALGVGDSVRSSLRRRAEERLGDVDVAMVAPRFARQELAASIAENLSADHSVAPAILLRASVVHDGNKQRANEVNLIGVDDSFASVVPGAADWELSSRAGLINRQLATEIGAEFDDVLLVNFDLSSDIPREHVLGDRRQTTARMRLRVAAVAPDSGASIFDLRNQQDTPRNIFVSLRGLQRALDRPGEINAILVSHSRGSASGIEVEARDLLNDSANRALRENYALEDLGLRLRTAEERGYVSLESREFLLGDSVVEAAKKSTSSPYLEVFTYLATGIRVDGHLIPYSTVAAVSNWTSPDGGESPALSGLESPIQKGQVVLNSWAADDAKAAAGAKADVSYYTYGADEELIEASESFQVSAVVALEDDAKDPDWTPKYPGVTDATTFADWDAPFPIDRSVIREPGPDADYWKEHHTTPKAFIALEDGARLWGSRWGTRTSFRVRLTADSRVLFEQRLRQFLDPTKFGLEFRSVRNETLKAAVSGTDFAMLFVSMSFFIIISALMLTAMTYRLSLERRSRELGLLGAVGFQRKGLARLMLAEGGVVAGVGALVGLGAGVGYAYLLILGLKTLWVDAVNAPFLTLDIAPMTLYTSVAATWLLVLLTISFVVRKLASQPPRRLIAGNASEAGHRARPQDGKKSKIVAIVFGILSALLFAISDSGAIPVTAAYFGIGGSLLIAALAGLSWRLRRPDEDSLQDGKRAMWRLGARNARRAPGRSLLTAGLIASATFVVVTVAASRRDPTTQEPRLESGDGGFALVARSASPIFAAIDGPKATTDLPLSDETAQLLRDSKARVFAARERPGDETSCLNLYRPTQPRILGLGPEFVERGGFAWAGTIEPAENPWTLLAKDYGENVIPAIGDVNTVMWILHSGVGKDLEMTDDHGGTVQLRIVAVTAQSIFQGALATSKAAFERHFRNRGFSTFFIESDAASAVDVRKALETDLADFGFDARTSGELLANFNRVQNTYLSTFLVLGGLGLLLGTVGLAAIVMRNVSERRGELALLSSLGFRRRDVASIVRSETLLLLFAGVAFGTSSALVSVTPNISSMGGDVSWSMLVATLVSVVVVAVGSCALATRSALAGPAVTALRSD